MPNSANTDYYGDEHTFSYEDLLADVDSRLSDAQSAWLSAIDSNTHLDRKTHELIRMVCTCALRNPPGVQRHARFAAESGATWEEIVSALAISQPAFGILPMAEALKHARAGYDSANTVEDEDE